MIKIDCVDGKMEYAWVQTVSVGVSNITDALDYNLAHNGIMYLAYRVTLGIINSIEEAVDYTLEQNKK